MAGSQPVDVNDAYYHRHDLDGTVEVLLGAVLYIVCLLAGVGVGHFIQWIRYAPK